MTARTDSSSMLVWIKSSASDPDECVEVAISGQVVLIRDSHDPSGTALVLGPGQWATMLAFARNGDFDAP